MCKPGSRCRWLSCELYNARMDKQLIQSDPSVIMGKPVIAGTRITVELILEKLAAGESIEQIVDAHPRLTKEAVLAALDFGNGENDEHI